VGVPDGQTMIHTNDLVVVFGKRKNIDRFIQINQ
jgi:Trk K+ transport system NAD-binding subunit